MIDLDFNRVSASIRGSYISLKQFDKRLYISFSGDNRRKTSLFYIELEEDVKLKIAPGIFKAKGKNLDFSVAFYGDDTFLLQADKPITLYQDRQKHGYNATNLAKQSENLYRIADTGMDKYIWMEKQTGKLEIEAPRQPGSVANQSIKLTLFPENGEGRLAVTVPSSIAAISNIPVPSFEDCVKAAQADFEQWNRAMQPKDALQNESSFVLWCNMVSPRGNYKQETMLCSKTAMDAIWSWDNAFSALALSKPFPKTAFYQFMLFYENMDAEGALPDLITSESISRIFTKPPVHGLIYRWCMERNDYFSAREQIAKIYPLMKKNTDWWLNCRGDEPCLWHGNDSGADNASCFDQSFSVISPAILGYLSAQCDLLADIADALRLNEDEAFYRQKAKDLADKILADYFDGEQLFVRTLPEKSPYYSMALQPYLALSAGRLLNSDLAQKAAEIIENNFLFAFGCASEMPNSEKFAASGYASYWRGSAWAPDQLILYRSLYLLGYDALAEKLLFSYKSALEKSGFYENHNPLTGEGNCDKGYNWSAVAAFI